MQAKAREHDLSRALADALLAGPDDGAEEARAWSSLAARPRAMGVDPEA